MLQVLPDLLIKLPVSPGLWAAQDEHLAASRHLLADAAVTLEEYPALDLAVVRIPASLGQSRARRYLRDEQATIHPFAINTATAASRILRVQGDRYEFEYRYESWVRLATRRVPLRVDLRGLAAWLNEREGDERWVAEDPNDVAPRLWMPDGGPSSVPYAEFFAALCGALTTAPVAWDPYDWQAPAVAAVPPGDTRRGPRGSPLVLRRPAGLCRGAERPALDRLRSGGAPAGVSSGSRRRCPPCTADERRG
jgi:hypothetical protein